MPEGPEGRQTHGQPSNATLQLSPADSFRRKEAAARALEAKLREVSRNARNFYDQPVRQLRARLRDAYAEVLLEDPQAAQARPCICILLFPIQLPVCVTFDAIHSVKTHCQACSALLSGARD